MKNNIYAFDNIVTNHSLFDARLSIKGIGSIQDGTESFVPNAPLSETVNGNPNDFVGTQYFLDNLTRDQAQALLHGSAYLEFWIECMDHSKPTENRRMYPLDIFVNAVNDPYNVRQMNGGGIGGEEEHPYIPPITDPPGSKEAIEKQAAMLKRLGTIDKTKIALYITGFKVEGTRTFVRIKTSLKNRCIVQDLLNGCVPAISIRTLCQFRHENGIDVAQSIKFVTVDYVRNPANTTSTSLPNINYVDNVNREVVQLNLAKTGTESHDIFGMETIEIPTNGNGTWFMVPESTKTMTKPTGFKKKVNKELDLDTIFKKAGYSIF